MERNLFNSIFNRAVITAGLIFSIFHAGYAQNNRNPLEDMVNAMKNDRVADMVKYFDSFVPITINNNQSVYSRNQAEVVLHDFFDKNFPKDFTVTESGSPNSTSKFAICTFGTPSGKYSAYILMKLKDSNYLLQELRLTKE